MTDPVVRFKDFSTSPEPVTFRIAPDDFQCVPEIPLDALEQMALLGEKMSVTGGRASAVYEFFDSIMMPESAAKFRERGQIGVANPIGMRAITEVIPWLMEVYGLRPTQPSDESSDGSEPTDTSSTDGA